MDAATIPIASWSLRTPDPDEVPTRILQQDDPTPDANQGGATLHCVLLAEDSEGRRLRLRLSALGLRVRLVHSRDELRAHVRAGPVDLVLLDRQPDEHSILEAVERLRPGLEHAVLLLGPGPPPEVGARLGAGPTGQQLREAIGQLCPAYRGESSVRWDHRKQSDAAALADEDNVIAGRFEVLGLLGSGGAANVYRVRDRLVGEEVALKLLRKSCRDPVGEERLLQELQMLRRLNHPTIVRPHDVGMWDGRPWFTMELLHGRSLRQHLRDLPHPMDDADLRHLAVQLADGLAAAHEEGIVHRDVKPGNVFVLNDGRIRLMDFGIAKSRFEDARLSATGQVLGTPCYVAPELLMRADGPLPAVDLFGLGVLLYEAATGRLPFRGENLEEIGRAICERTPTAPSQLNEHLSDGMEAVIVGLLAKDPRQRPIPAVVRRRLGA